MPCIGHFWNLPPMPMDDPQKSVCHTFLDDIFIVRPYRCIYTCHHIRNILFILWDQIDHQVSATRLHQMSTMHTRIMTFIDSFMPEVPMKHRCFPWFQVAKTKSPHEGFPLLGSSFIPSTGSRIFLGGDRNSWSMSQCREKYRFIFGILWKVPSDSKLKGTPIDGEALGVHACNQWLPLFPLLLLCLCPSAFLPYVNKTSS